MADDTKTAERDAFIGCHMQVMHSDEMMAAHVWDNDHLVAKLWRAGRVSLAASAGSEPVKRVFLVATGEEYEGEATYTRYDDAPPPLCDSECLYTHPSPPEGAGTVSVPAKLIEDVLESLYDYRSGLEFGRFDRELIGRLEALLPTPPASEAKGASQ